MAFNILVADDSETMRAVVKKTVEMSGVPIGEFHEAENGKKALAIMENNWIDVVLSDVNMPEMGGMEFLQVVSQHEDFKHIPVIFITTESSEARMEEAKELGVAGYIKKPFVPETVRQILYEVLEKAYEHRMADVPPEEQVEDEGDMDF